MNSILVKRFWIVFKVAIAVISLFIIYNQLRVKNPIENFYSILEEITNDNQKIFLSSIVFLLMLVNWGIESYKWKLLVKPITDVNFQQSIRAVLTGITLSFYTPNRVGEFAGRVMHLESKSRISSALVTFIGSIAQLFITIIVGSIGLMICLPDFMELSKDTFFLIYSGVSLCLIGLLLIYFRIKKFEQMFLKFKWTRKFSKYFEAFDHLTFSKLLQILVLSFLRYSVYVTQFVLVLILLDVQFGLFKMYAAVVFTLLAITVVPTVAFSEPAVRASVSQSILSVYADNGFNIMLASFAVWFVNLVLPAIAGSFTLLFVHLKGDDQHDV